MEHFPEIPGYKIEKIIGKGATATVYKATQQALKRKVAIKVLDPGLLNDMNYLRRFISEAELASKLNHSNIVTIIDIGKPGKPGNPGNYCYIIMEYLGNSLKERMRSNEIPVEDALRIVKKLAQALDYAHSKKVVHRDVKPGNILFREDKTPVLADFGVALIINIDANMNDPGRNMGTIRYMSPEQHMGEMADHLSDIYSLGVVLYEMLTGVDFMPRTHAGISKRNPNAPVPYLPDHLKQYQPLIKKMMAVNKNDRAQSGRQVVEMIDTLKTPVIRKKKKRILPVILIISVIAFLAVVALIFQFKKEPKENANLSLPAERLRQIMDNSITNPGFGQAGPEVTGGEIRFTPPGGIFENQVEVQLNSNPLKSDKGDVIESALYYTFDGSEPVKAKGTKYTKSKPVVFPKNGTYTLKARLFSKVGKYEGPVCSEIYTVKPPDIVVGGKIGFTKPGGEYSEAIQVQINFDSLRFSGNAGKVIESDIYYTIGAGEPTAVDGKRYSPGEPILLAEEGKHTIKARVISKDGKYKGPVYYQTYIIVPPAIETIFQIERLSERTRQDIIDKTENIVIEIEGISDVRKNGELKILLSISPTGICKVEEISGVAVSPQEKLAEVKEALNRKITGLKFFPPMGYGIKSVKIKIWIEFGDVFKKKNKVSFRRESVRW